VVAEWLSSLNFQVSQLEFLQKKSDGTGEWLLKSSMYKDWRDGAREVLWCPGIREMTSFCMVFYHSLTAVYRAAGSGKTILTYVMHQ
jgi:hypothetical protein